MKSEALSSKLKNERTAEALARKANYGLAASTHEAYKTAINHIKRCEEEVGIDMSLPFDENKTLEFMGWMEARGLKSRLMSTYISGIRAFHIASGFKDPFLRDPMVKLILKGQDNWDKIQAKIDGKDEKLPITKSMMKHIKQNLLKASWSKTEKRLFWAVATLAWSGSFRIHELCSRNAKEFDTQTTLLWKDLSVGELKVGRTLVKTVGVHVKSPKVDRVGAGDNIEVFQLDNFMCPTTALAKYREETSLKEEPEMPVFRLDLGLCMTGAEMNKRLSVLTADVGGLVPGGGVRCHSFRSGVPSEMARAGMDPESIQAVGRWRSDAYKTYVKLPLSRRAEMARSMGR